MNNWKILLNSDGSTFFVKGGVTLTLNGVDQKTVKVENLDVEKALKDKKYVNDLINSSKIKEKKHGT